MLLLRMGSTIMECITTQEDGSSLMATDWGPKHNNTYNLHQLNTSHAYHLNTFIHHDETNNPGLSLNEISLGPQQVNWGVHYSSIFLDLQQIDHDAIHSHDIQKEIIFRPLHCGEKDKNNTSQHQENLVNYSYICISIFNM